MIGAGLLLPTLTPAQAKTSYKVHKYKKFKGSKKFKVKKYKAHRAKYKAPKVRH